MGKIIGKDFNPDLKGNLEVYKLPINLKYKIAKKSQNITTKEGIVSCKKGDFINEFLKTYDIKNNEYATKKKILVYAKKMEKVFSVKVSWSNHLLKGKKDDYLVMYGENDYGVVDKEIFKKTYYILNRYRSVWYIK